MDNSLSLVRRKTNSMRQHIILLKARINRLKGLREQSERHKRLLQQNQSSRQSVIRRVQQEQNKRQERLMKIAQEQYQKRDKVIQRRQLNKRLKSNDQLLRREQITLRARERLIQRQLSQREVDRSKTQDRLSQKSRALRVKGQMEEKGLKEKALLEQKQITSKLNYRQRRSSQERVRKTLKETMNALQEEEQKWVDRVYQTQMLRDGLQRQLATMNLGKRRASRLKHLIY